jgi:hypothetical protein
VGSFGCKDVRRGLQPAAVLEAEANSLIRESIFKLNPVPVGANRCGTVNWYSIAFIIEVTRTMEEFFLVLFDSSQWF